MTDDGQMTSIFYYELPRAPHISVKFPRFAAKEHNEKNSLLENFDNFRKFDQISRSRNKMSEPKPKDNKNCFIRKDIGNTELAAGEFEGLSPKIQRRIPNSPKNSPQY